MRALAYTLIASLVTASVGWTYSVSARVAALEVQRDSLAEDVKVIREDVRELRRKLLRDVP